VDSTPGREYMTRFKTFEIHFRHRDYGTLDDAYARVSATSKADAIKTGKALAESRQWWYMDTQLISEE
jgi:hypothetical protein